MLVTLLSVQIVTRLLFFHLFKCVIPCTTIVTLCFVTINVQLQTNALSFCLCLSFRFVADCLCVSAFSMSLCVSSVSGLLCQASGRRLSQGSPSRLPQLLRQRPALLLLLCSPPVWLFTASSVSINTAAPLLTKAYSRTTGKGHCRAWVQWVRHDKNKNPLQPP